ncbi:hypothetical protein IRJ41_017310, partial [Triplophysa rosa]
LFCHCASHWLHTLLKESCLSMEDVHVTIRKKIIGDEPLISVVMDRWPALCDQRQISAKFNRIVTTGLLQSSRGGGGGENCSL